MVPPKILLTAARAQRVAAQYLQSSTKTLVRTDTAAFEFLSCDDPRRKLRVWQKELGTVTFEEFHHQQTGGDRCELVYQGTFALPAIGPIDFNVPL